MLHVDPGNEKLILLSTLLSHWAIPDNNEPPSPIIEDIGILYFFPTNCQWNSISFLAGVLGIPDFSTIHSWNSGLFHNLIMEIHTLFLYDFWNELHMEDIGISDNFHHAFFGILD